MFRHDEYKKLRYTASARQSQIETFFGNDCNNHSHPHHEAISIAIVNDLIIGLNLPFTLLKPTIFDASCLLLTRNLPTFQDIRLRHQLRKQPTIYSGN